jgi:hypothetical protein
MAEALSTFHFPDDLWARVIYDLILATRAGDPPVETTVPALVSIYFGRVGSFVIENRRQTTDEAEERVERQAREFELLKPYLVERWRERFPTTAPATPAGATAAAASRGGAGAGAHARGNGAGRSGARTSKRGRSAEPGR